MAKPNPMVKLHPVFVKNQVLTDEHLNTAFEFLNNEDHLTRAHLLGQGIVSGLELSSDLRTQVTLGSGSGLTSSGELISVAEATTYAYWREYTEPASNKYFAPRNVAPVWELLQAAPITSKADEALISSKSGLLQGKIAVLYLDIEDQARGDCGENDCNARGKRRQFTERLLLFCTEDVGGLTLPSDTFFTPEVAPGVLRVPRPRLIDRAGQVARRDHEGLVSAFLESFQAVQPLLGRALADVSLRLRSLGFSARESGVAEVLRRAWDTAATHKRGIQYVYDWLKDLTAAYAELMEVAVLAGGRRCPPDSFPRHLLLGAVEDNLRVGYRPPQVPRAPSVDRFPFLPSHVVGPHAELREQAASLAQRLMLQLEGFSWKSSDRIVITPDAGPRAPLSLRAIPCYYGGVAEGAPRLLDHWSFRRTRSGWQRTILGYESAQYSGPGPVANPLDYDHEGAPFFRIEGHLEQPVETVLKVLEEERRSSGLPFNVVAVSLDETVNDQVLSKDCLSADLTVDHDKLREEIRYALQVEKAFFEELPAPVAQGLVEGTISSKYMVHRHVYVQVVGTSARVEAVPQPEKEPGAPRKYTYEFILPKGHFDIQAITDDNYVSDPIRVDVQAGQPTFLPLTINRQLMPPATGVSPAGPAGAPTPPATSSAGPTTVSTKAVKELVQEVMGKLLPGGEGADSLKLVDLTIEWARKGLPNILEQVALPARLVVLIRGLLTLLPGDLATMKVDVFERIMAGLKNTAERLEDQIRALESLAPLSARHAVALQHLQTIMSFSHVESLLTLQRALEDRRKQQKRRLCFGEFVLEHPSLEHQGGAPRGGTFVIAYQAGTVKADFALSYLCCDPCGPMLLKLPDALPPPQNQWLRLDLVNPVKVIKIPEVTGDLVLRSIITDPEGVASIREGQIHIKGKPSIFQLPEYVIEYLVQNIKSGKTAIGQIIITLVGQQLEKPKPNPYEAKDPAEEMRISLAKQLPEGLPAFVRIHSAQLKDHRLGTVGPVDEDTAILFKPKPEWFNTIKRAVIAFTLRHLSTDQTVDGELEVVLKQAIEIPEMKVVIDPGSTHQRRIELPFAGKPGYVVDSISSWEGLFGKLDLEDSGRALRLMLRESQPGSVGSEAIARYIVKDGVTGAQGVGFIRFRKDVREMVVKATSATEPLAIQLENVPEGMTVVKVWPEAFPNEPLSVTGDRKITFQPRKSFKDTKASVLLYELRDANGAVLIEGRVTVKLELPPLVIPELSVRIDARRDEFSREIRLPLPPEVEVIGDPIEPPDARLYGRLVPREDKRSFGFRPARGAPAAPAVFKYRAKDTKTDVESECVLRIAGSEAARDEEVLVPASASEVLIEPKFLLQPDMKAVGPVHRNGVVVGEILKDGKAIRFRLGQLFRTEKQEEIVYTALSTGDASKHESHERLAIVRAKDDGAGETSGGEGGKSEEGETGKTGGGEGGKGEGGETGNTGGGEAGKTEGEAGDPPVDSGKALPDITVRVLREYDHLRRIRLPLDNLPKAVIERRGAWDNTYGSVMESEDGRAIEFKPRGNALDKPLVVEYGVKGAPAGGEKTGLVKIQLVGQVPSDMTVKFDASQKVLPLELAAVQPGMELVDARCVPEIYGVIEKQQGGKQIVFRPSKSFLRPAPSPEGGRSVDIVYTVYDPRKHESFDGVVVVTSDEPGKKQRSRR